MRKAFNLYDAGSTAGNGNQPAPANVPPKSGSGKKAPNSDKRETFILYRSFVDSLRELPDNDKGKIYEAICDYALDMKEPDLSGTLKALYGLIKPQLDANWKKYLDGRKGGEYGKLGGAPKGNSNAAKEENNPKTTPKQPQNNPKTTPNV